MADNMNLSKSYTRDDIKQSVSSYDKIIVGSDIVWGLDITNSDLTYFLDFVSDKKKKYAFSSSIGSEWSQSEQLIVGPLLRDFNRIAVREEQAVKWVYEASGFRADLVCDPTMLLPGSEWAKYASNIGANQKYVLVYFDTQNRDCLKKAGILAKKYNLKIVLINYWRPVWGVCNMAPTAPENFIGLFKNASFVVTASYHGLLFSTYFQREVIYYNRAHKSRMSSLGDILGISDRDGTSNIEFDKMDYSSINNRLEQFRNSSLSILTEMLHD